MHLLTSGSRILVLAFVCVFTQPRAEQLKRMEETEFGKMPDGAPVRQFTLRNAKGMVAKIISYGATITELQAADRNGALTNVVLGAATLERRCGQFLRRYETLQQR